MAKRRTQRQENRSGATGGPAAGAGLNYQVDFAILQALELISRALVNPLEEAKITMEPRIIQHRSVTRWDVSISHPMTLTEAKLKPHRDDILEWLDRVEVGLNTAGA